MEGPDILGMIIDALDEFSTNNRDDMECEQAQYLENSCLSDVFTDGDCYCAILHGQDDRRWFISVSETK